MPDFAAMKLGKRPATVDRRTLKLERYLDLSALPPIPDVIDWSTKVAQWPMFLNDSIGDCVIAAAAHQEEAASAQNGRELTITDQDVLAGYETVGGYRPGDPSTDEGCDPLVALKWWRATGIAGNKIGAYVTVDPANATLVRAALYLFGGLFVGLALPLTAQDQGAAGKPWDVLSTTGRGAPGSWGGHMVFLVRQRGATAPYDVVTWGMLQPMTQAFLATYSPAEVFAVIPQAWLNDHGLAPNGLNLAQLTADLAIVSGQQPQPVATSTYLSLSASSITVGQPLTVNATVTGTAANGSEPTGSVTLTGAAGVTAGPVQLVQGGATFHCQPTAAGSYTIIGDYGGDPAHSSSQGTATLTVTAPQPAPDVLQPLYDWLLRVSQYEVQAHDKAELAVIVKTILQWDPDAASTPHASVSDRLRAIEARLFRGQI